MFKRKTPRYEPQTKSARALKVVLDNVSTQYADVDKIIRDIRSKPLFTVQEIWYRLSTPGLDPLVGQFDKGRAQLRKKLTPEELDKIIQEFDKKMLSFPYQGHGMNYEEDDDDWEELILRHISQDGLFVYGDGWDDTEPFESDWVSRDSPMCLFFMEGYD